ncbi:unnamed protein product, partial [Allacma fusca]
QVGRCNAEREMTRSNPCVMFDLGCRFPMGSFRISYCA